MQLKRRWSQGALLARRKRADHIGAVEVSSGRSSGVEIVVPHVIWALLERAEACYDGQWGLLDKITSWGWQLPIAQRLYDALFADEAIEWNRIGAFQQVTLRLIAEQLLPEAVRGTTFVRGELSFYSVLTPSL